MRTWIRNARIALLGEVQGKGYLYFHVTFFLCTILITSGIAWAIERYANSYQAENTDYPALLASLTSAMCVTGMGFVDFAQLTIATQLLHVLLFEVGSTVLWSAVPSYLKLRKINKFLSSYPRETLSSHSQKRPLSASLSLRAESDSLDHLLLERSALRHMIVLIFIYYALVQLLGFVLLSLYASYSGITSSIYRQGVHPAWWAFFLVASGFQQSGFGLTEVGLQPYLGDTAVVLILCLVMLLGGSLYPIALRLFVRLVRYIHRTPESKAPYDYILHDPTKVCTHLFPPVETRLLCIIFVIIFGAQILSFGVLNSGRPFMVSLSGWGQFMLTVFQAVNTRATGFPMYDLSETHPAMQFLFVLFMVLSAYPFIVTLYENRYGAPSEIVNPPLSPEDEEEAEEERMEAEMEKAEQERKVEEIAVADRAAEQEEANAIEMPALSATAPSSSEPAMTTPSHSAQKEPFSYATPSNTPAPLLPHDDAKLARRRKQQQRFDSSTPSSSQSTVLNIADLQSSSQSNSSTSSPLSRPVGPSNPSTVEDNKRSDRKTAELVRAMRYQLQGLFISDAFWLFTAITLVCIFDSHSLESDSGFSIFKVIFEIASAYGNVGLSLGYPNNPIGFAAVWSSTSQFVIAAVLLLGRHRGLPYTIRQAVGIPPLVQTHRRNVAERERQSMEQSRSEEQRGRKPETVELPA